VDLGKKLTRRRKKVVHGKNFVFSNPRCGLSGHKDNAGVVHDIRLKLEGRGLDVVCPRPRECPWNDVHGQNIEIGNCV